MVKRRMVLSNVRRDISRWVRCRVRRNRVVRTRIGIGKIIGMVI